MRPSGGHADPDAWVVLPPPELEAVVHVAPAPEMALASVRELVTPVYDDQGELVDWALFASGFDHPDAVHEYLRWRRTWRPSWPIGPLDAVGSLAREVADIEHGLGRTLDAVLARLLAAAGATVLVEPDDAADVLDELEMVRLALSVDPRSGRGIVDDMPVLTRSSGLARAWAPPVDEVVLAATTATAVVLRPDSDLTVLHDGPTFRTFGGVTGVDLRTEMVVVGNDRGASLRLDQRSARPLGWLVPRSLRWHVVSVPLAVVWAPALTGLAAAAAASVAHGETVVITGEIGVA